MFTHTRLLAPLVLFVLIALSPSAAEARRTSLTAEEIRNTLQTARPEENGFIDDVIDRVNNASRPVHQRLPASMVESTFQWARTKNTRHRFQYFRRALTVQAARIGVRL